MPDSIPKALFESFSKTSVLIVGDVMLDRYWWGSVGRISPEAPVPIVKLNKTTLAAGGAANVAVNVAGLGATPLLLGSVGIDDEANSIRTILASSGVDTSHLIDSDERHTTVKTRVIAHSQQVVRVDQERDDQIGLEIEARIEKQFDSLIGVADVVIISDYSKGLLTDSLLSAMIQRSKRSGKAVLVDPKGKNFQKYREATILTPNRREAADACNLHEDGSAVDEIAGNRLLHELNVESLLVTQGEEGMTLFSRDREAKHFPAVARKVYDVTGAGDTVIAALGTALGAGADIEIAVGIANAAAGFVVEQVGTAAITIEDLRGFDRGSLGATR